MPFRAAVTESRSPVPTVPGDTVVLRAWTPDDVDALVEICQDPEIPRWTVIPSPYGEAEARSFVAAQGERWASLEAAPFAIADPDSDRVLGSIEITLHERMHRRGEVGYWVAAEARGRGVAQDAVRAVSRWGFQTLGLARIELLTDPENHVSQAVAEAAGYTREGIMRSYREMKGRRVDFVCFSLISGDLLPGED
jgi:RimJ/RimL family protein N-acetyltransferase